MRRRFKDGGHCGSIVHELNGWHGACSCGDVSDLKRFRYEAQEFLFDHFGIQEAGYGSVAGAGWCDAESIRVRGGSL